MTDLKIKQNYIKRFNLYNGWKQNQAMYNPFENMKVMKALIFKLN